jgi:preprotein translocase subunit SecG
MIVLLLLVHVFIALALIGVILLQKSEGGALGMGGGGMSGFMTGRSTANLLTRTTAILAAAFMLTSILLVVLSNRVQTPHSILESAPSGPPGQGTPLIPAVPTPPGQGSPLLPAEPASPPPAAPAVPSGPTAPLAR